MVRFMGLVIPQLYSTAGKIAALDIVPDYSVGTEEQKRIDIYNQYGIDGLRNWIAYRKYANTDGKTGINQSEARAWLNASDMSDSGRRVRPAGNLLDKGVSGMTLRRPKNETV